MTPRCKRVFVLTFSLGVLLFAKSGAEGQTCTLRISDLPASSELRGFRLGMTNAEVKARVPQVTFGKTDESGVSKTTINPHFDPAIDASAFDGVRSVSLDFLDTRLTSLWFGFDHTFKWKTVPEFVRGISETLKLPEAWQSWRAHGQQLKCADFLLTVTMLGEGVSFRIVDQEAEDVIALRRQTLEEEKTATEDAEPQLIFGNKRTKTYYPIGCTSPGSIAEKDRWLFSSVAEAEQAGFTRARNCP